MQDVDAGCSSYDFLSLPHALINKDGDCVLAALHLATLAHGACALDHFALPATLVATVGALSKRHLSKEEGTPYVD